MAEKYLIANDYTFSPGNPWNNFQNAIPSEPDFADNITASLASGLGTSYGTAPGDAGGWGILRCLAIPDDVPDGSLIEGIYIELVARAGEGGSITEAPFAIPRLEIGIAKSGALAVSKSVTVNLSGGTDRFFAYGSIGELWDDTWNVDDVNGIEIWVRKPEWATNLGDPPLNPTTPGHISSPNLTVGTKSEDTNATRHLDYAIVKVFYAEPSTPGSIELDGEYIGNNAVNLAWLES
jgi:hypothetical protein